MNTYRQLLDECAKVVSERGLSKLAELHKVKFVKEASLSETGWKWKGAQIQSRGAYPSIKDAFINLVEEEIGSDFYADRQANQELREKVLLHAALNTDANGTIRLANACDVYIMNDDSATDRVRYQWVSGTLEDPKGNFGFPSVEVAFANAIPCITEKLETELQMGYKKKVENSLVF